MAVTARPTRVVFLEFFHVGLVGLFVQFVESSFLFEIAAFEFIHALLPLSHGIVKLALHVIPDFRIEGQAVVVVGPIEG